MYLGSIVLAGGRSRRMGQPKEALPFLGTTLLGHTVDTLLRCTHPVVVVARDEAQALPPLPLEAELTYDAEPGGGPLVGLVAGLRALRGDCDAAFVTSCDAPFISERAIGALAERLGGHDLLMPSAGGVLQPLAAVYRVGVLGALEALLASGQRAPRFLVERVNARILEGSDLDEIEPGGRWLRTVNSQDEYRQALAEAQLG